MRLVCVYTIFLADCDNRIAVIHKHVLLKHYRESIQNSKIRLALKKNPAAFDHAQSTAFK